MVDNGYDIEYAKRVFRQLEGFGSYGFPESHAVSFALLAYVSSYLKYYYPDVFACALLNSMPMGFYQPAQIIIDAKSHGVEIRPVDINYSEWNNLLEEIPIVSEKKYRALRLGFRHVKGLNEEDMKLLVRERKNKYTSIYELREIGLPESALEKLADADAFRSISLDRRLALWEVTTKDHRNNTFFSGKQRQDHEDEKIPLPEMRLSEHVVHDYAATSFSLKAHPVSFVREQLTSLRVLSTSSLAEGKDGDLVKVAGLVLVRQRPGTASGICFITIEDETGSANLVVFQKLFDEYRKEIIQSRLLMVEGKLQREGEVIHVVVKRCFNLSNLLQRLTAPQKESLTLKPMSRSDETTSPFVQKKDEVVQGKIFHEGRNFR
jgi:error-prone DNA polymerase